jgi:hypothetical protein
VLAFGLYESFRLLLPGGLAVLVFGLAFRLAAGAANGQGGLAQTVTSADAGQFLVAALASGFLLYLLDVPAHLRLYTEADPARGVILPTQRLSELWAGTPNAGRAYAGYFLLSDAHLPPESHRRVYFFGSTYRIYAYARLLAAAALGLVSPLAVWLAAQDPTASLVPSGHWLAAAASLVLASAFTGAVGELSHAARATAPKPGRTRQERTREYRRKFATRTRSVAGPAIAVVAAQTAAVGVASRGTAASLAAATLLAAVSVVLWGLVEVGPPPPPRAQISAHRVILVRLGAAQDEDTQYPPAQRTVVDLALLLPVAVAVAGAAQANGAPPSYVLLWGLLSVTCTLVMAVRKHEQRLLATYKDQLAWLELHRESVLAVGREGWQKDF